jgi:hypothetical protein
MFLHQIDILTEGHFLLVNVTSQLVTNVILTKIKLSFNLIKDLSASCREIMLAFFQIMLRDFFMSRA